jgi:hypothetical protein
MDAKIAVASIGFNRPELHEISLDFLSLCRRKDEVDVYIYIDDFKDDARTANLVNHAKGFNKVEFVPRTGRYGLSRNIMYALLETADKGYDYVILLENDVVVSKDFLELFIYVGTHFDLRELKCMLMCSYRPGTGSGPLKGVPLIQALYRSNWYFPLGPGFPKFAIDIMRPYITPALLPTNEEAILREMGASPIDDLVNKLKPELEQINPGSCLSRRVRL